MKTALWIAGGLLLIVAAAAVWFAFQRPDFVLGLAMAAAALLLKGIGGQVAKDMADPEVDRKNKEAAKHPAGPPPEGTGVTTGKVIKQPAATRRNRPKP